MCLEVHHLTLQGPLCLVAFGHTFSSDGYMLSVILEISDNVQGPARPVGLKLQGPSNKGEYQRIQAVRQNTNLPTLFFLHVTPIKII